VSGIIVRVKDGQRAIDARKIASKSAMDEGANFWTDCKKSTCK